MTDVQLTSVDMNRWSTAGPTSVTVAARIVDSGGASVLSADLMAVNVLPQTSGDWINTGAQTSRTVNAPKQAAATLVALELQVTVVGTTSTNLDVGIDNLAITATYTTGGIPDKAGAGIIGP